MSHTPKKNRDAEATANRIISAAQHIFHEKGYDASTTREIAVRADVNINLIHRYFGSKLGLFKEAVLPHLDLVPLLGGKKEEIAHRLAILYVDTGPKDEFDAFVVLTRSITSPEVGPLLMARIEERALKPLMNILEGSNKRARATLIATQLAGLILRFRVMSHLYISKADQNHLKQLLEKNLLALLLDNG